MLNWYLQNGKDSDVVVSSRIRLARNFNNIPFTTKFSKEQAQEVKNKVKEITPSIGYGLKFIDLNDLVDHSRLVFSYNSVKYSSSARYWAFSKFARLK